MIAEKYCDAKLQFTLLLNRLALDFWSLLRMKWVDTAKFGLKS